MPQRFAEATLSPIEVAQLLLECAEIAVGHSERGIEPQRSPVVSQCVIVAALFVPYPAQAIARFGMPGIEPQGDFITGDGLVVLFLCLHRAGQVAMVAGRVWLQVDGTPVPGHRFIEPAFFLEGLSHVVVDHGQARVEA